MDRRLLGYLSDMVEPRVTALAPVRTLLDDDITAEAGGLSTSVQQIGG
ncbi:MAG: hypothetical protein ABWY58_01010 [Aeromicrobium sp.]